LLLHAKIKFQVSKMAIELFLFCGVYVIGNSVNSKFEAKFRWGDRLLFVTLQVTLMIKSFRHKGLRRSFIDNDRSLLSPALVKKIDFLLDLLDLAEVVFDMDVKGVQLHELKGDRKGVWSVRVSGNWRITFRFEDGHAYDVNLEDYH
jgi:toxin HigB-1